MAALLRYELKKLLSRKLLWLLFAVCMAFLLYQHAGMLDGNARDMARGIRDIYGAYEGRTVTQAFQSDVKRAYDEYIAAHADRFETIALDDGSVFHTAKWGYDSGVQQAFEELSGGSSVESLREYVRNAEEALKRGTSTDGSPLPYWARMNDESVARDGYTTPVAHYAYGWSYLMYSTSPAPGVFLLFLAGIAFLPLFNGESTARMDGILLGTAKRGRAALAKLLAASCLAAALAVLFFGIDLLFTALTYGLDGASQPSVSVTGWYGSSPLTVGQAYALAWFALALAAVASAALVALSSALFRHPLVSLLFAGALVAAQFLIGGFFTGNELGLYLENHTFMYHIIPYFNLLPATALVSDTMEQLIRMKFLIFGLLFPALLAGLVYWLAARRFLKPRKS